MNDPNSEAFDNPTSTEHQAAAKFASEVIDSIASQLKVNIVAAAQRGESLEQTERSVRDPNAVCETLCCNSVSKLVVQYTSG